jgi:hypothetical protein
MIGRLILALAALAGLAVLGTAAPASAEVGSTTNCISNAEYRLIHRGMTQTRVERLTDATPVMRGGRGIRAYDACNRSAWVSVDYDARHRVELRYRIGHD